MNGPKRILQRHGTLLMVLLAYFFVPVYAQGQKLDSLTVVAKGHGVIADALDERKFTAALAVLRQDGTVLITMISDLQLQAQGRGP